MTVEYAYKLKTTRVKEEDFPYTGQTLSFPGTVADFARDLQNSDIEKMLVLYLSSRNELICLQVSEGSIGQVAIYPREVAKHAILSGATGVILVHNHPGGHLEPSKEDISITKQIKEGLSLFNIKLLDHVILNDDKFYSMVQAGIAL